MSSHAACFSGRAGLTFGRRVALTARAAPVAPRAVASGMQRAATTAAPTATGSAPLRLSTKAESSRIGEAPNSIHGSFSDSSVEEEHLESVRAKFRALRKMTNSGDAHHGMYSSHLCDRLATEL